MLAVSVELVWIRERVEVAALQVVVGSRRAAGHQVVRGKCL